MTEARQLKNRIRRCTSCELHKTCQSPIPFEGKPPADLLIIGEAPGGVEDQRHRPFVGPAGKILRNAINELGLKDYRLMIANTVSCFPAPGRTPTPEEIKACKFNLRDQLKISEAPFVLLLGRVALNSFKPDKQISSYRGKVWKRNNRVWMATWHPAYVLRNPPSWKVFMEDINKMRTMMEKELYESYLS